VIHLLQLLLKLLANIEDARPDNRIAGSALIFGIWLMIAANLFGHQLGAWRELLLWSGWIVAAFGVYLLVRRKTRAWRLRTNKPPRRIIDKRYF
jgi:hypothetical protein